MKIGIVTADLGLGGAQRQMTLIANALVARGHQVQIFTWDTRDSFYTLEAGVTHVKMGGESQAGGPIQGILNNFLRVRLLKDALREFKPSVVLSTNNRNNVRAIFACRGLGIPVVVREASDPFTEPLEREWQFLRRYTYPKADRVLLQTQAVVAFFSPEVQKKVVVIPNPIKEPSVLHVHSPEGRMVVGLGRLDKVKGFDQLISAFAKLPPGCEDWKCTIHGEGPAREELQKQIQDLGLKERVSLPGATKNPPESLAEGDIFVLSSRREGFPNALCEAMIVGLPVVSMDCPNGPNIVIRTGQNGILVPDQDIEALAGALGQLMLSADLREKLGKAARPSIIENYGETKVMDRIESMLNEIAR